jgi:hypothetical protein
LVQAQIISHLIEPFTRNEKGEIEIAVMPLEPELYEIHPTWDKAHPLRADKNRTYRLLAFPTRGSSRSTSRDFLQRDWMMTKLLLDLSNISLRV